MCMNWMRTILDGFAMAAYFNLFAAASPALWRGQYHGGRDNRILASGPDRVYPVDDGQFL